MAGLVALASLVGMQAAPASAGDYYWSQSGCSGYYTHPDVYWYGVPGQGTYYVWLYHGPGWDHPYWVGGGFYQLYKNQGWECGWLGPVVGDEYSAGPLYVNPYTGERQYTIQKFEHGYIFQYYGHFGYCPESGINCWTVN